VIRDPNETRPKLAAVAGDKYSYREMDDFTDLIEKTLKSVPQASKVSRAGILPEKVFLLYSQERIASYGLKNIRPVKHSGCTQHHARGWSAGSCRKEPLHRSFGRVQE